MIKKQIEDLAIKLEKKSLDEGYCLLGDIEEYLLELWKIKNKNKKES